MSVAFCSSIVANSLDAQDLKEDRTVPHPDKIRTVGLNVATAVVLEAQKLGLAGKTLGKNSEEVTAAIKELMWSPDEAKAPKAAAAPKVPAAAMEEQKVTLIGA
jgi:hypothetical protein